MDRNSEINHERKDILQEYRRGKRSRVVSGQLKLESVFIKKNKDTKLFFVQQLELTTNLLNTKIWQHGSFCFRGYRYSYLLLLFFIYDVTIQYRQRECSILFLTKIHW